MSGLSLSLAIAGCFRDDSDESEQREVFEDPNPQLFDGEGPTIIEEVRNEGGFFAVEYEHDGDGDFTVELRSEEASHSLVLVDREGAVEGRWAEGTYDAEYVIEVTATGDWHLRVEQPRPSQEDVFSLPASLSGEWPDYAGPYEFTGQTSINATYSGEGRFVARILGPHGNPRKPLFETDSSFEGETTETYDGAGWVYIEAYDEWTLEINR